MAPAMVGGLGRGIIDPPMTYLDPARDEIERFCRFLRPGILELKVEEGFEAMFFKRQWEDGLNRGAWFRSGVYLIYAMDGELLYVGKATATFEKRIRTLFRKNPDADA